MCGIAGIVASRTVDPGTVEAMCDLMVHRGPDDSGLWSSADGRIVMGHRRLAIIDPTPAGHQPMVDGSGRFVLNFNGEIYNYPELGERLKREGITFQSHSDTEVLLEAFRHWGPNCLTELNGMFAFALYDGAQGKLYCARDRFGEKPFLFADGKGFFAFASEYKALLSLTEVPADIDRLRLARFLHQPSQGLDDGRETVFTGIRQLLPGELLTLDTHTLDWNVRRYWDIAPDADLARLSEEDAAARFRELLTDSVRIRMRSDVPQGSCLSGGLDSASIVCIARRLLGDDTPYHVFTGRFPGTDADEWAHASVVAAHTDTVPHVVVPDPEGFMDDLSAFAWHNEIPVGSTSQYAQWCVFRLAKENGITVLLDGQGADEILGGYEQYFRIYLDDNRQGDAGAKKEEESAIRARYPLALHNRRQSFGLALPHTVRRTLAMLTGKGSDVLFGLEAGLAADVARANADIDTGPFGGLAGKLYSEAFHTHLPTLLRYGDRNSMAHSREVRLPFCDHRLAELSLSLPPGHLMGKAQTKRLLRESMRDILPESIRTRWPKQGFLPPQEIWFRNGLLAKAEEVIQAPDFAASGLWNVHWWRKLAQRLRRGEEHLAWVLWRPLITETWRVQFIERMRKSPHRSVFA
jgi:asparagine synthase (glutamine-hydrolysing)